MPDSAAAPTPLTVLVLAWDEASPAVRTLLDPAAASAPYPLLVLLPPAAPEAAPAQPAVAAPPVAEATPTAATVATATEATTPTAPAASPGAALPAAASLPAPSGPAATSENRPRYEAAAGTFNAAASEELPVTEAAPVSEIVAVSTTLPATPVAAAQPVRVLRLDYATPGSASRIRTRPFDSPAAPYLGASGPASGSRAAETTTAPGPAPAPPATPAKPAAQAATATPAATEAGQLVTGPASATPTYFSEEEETLAPDLEGDLLPLAPEAATPVLATIAGGLVLAAPLPDEATAVAADAASFRVAEAAFSPLPAPTETAAAEATTPTFDTPAPTAAPAAGPAAPAGPPAAGAPAAWSVLAEYPAPDLNTQVIRYARFAVPAALAEQPFGAIYAPAWPTWLAALELRQRTRRPLVLHLRALAAGSAPADTAAGWPAEIQRQALRQADLVLAETYALARRLRRELGVASAAVRVVPAADGAAVARALRRARRE